MKDNGISIDPIAFVHAARTSPEDDFWGGSLADITLTAQFDQDAFAGIDAFSHVEVLFIFHQVRPDQITTGARHPRNNAAWPKVGIFAQRGKNRPNRIGSTVCRIVRLQGRTLTVTELDAIEGTPVIDIKPVLKEFLPRQETTQPDWATEIMTDYWSAKSTGQA
ncbi:MAG: SAM-dependent methyltransferase [Chryseolinea sp.]